MRPMHRRRAEKFRSQSLLASRRFAVRRERWKKNWCGDADQRRNAESRR
nr:MAG TPA: hypothetical protein [Caudoviricetes sp.]